MPGRISCFVGVAFVSGECPAEGADVVGLYLYSGTKIVSNMGRLGLTPVILPARAVAADFN